jgi:hypothetical protein
MADAIGTLKSAYDLTKDLVNLTETAARQAKVAELQRQILDAQESALAANQERTTLVDAIGKLEKEVANLKAWNAGKDRYELVALFDSGLFAYIPKEGMESGEPPHALCAKCFQHTIKSVLQSNGDRDVHRHEWFCPECGFRARHQWRRMDQLIAKTREVKRAN